MPVGNMEIDVLHPPFPLHRMSFPGHDGMMAYDVDNYRREIDRAGCYSHSCIESMDSDFSSACHSLASSY